MSAVRIACGLSADKIDKRQRRRGIKRGRTTLMELVGALKANPPVVSDLAPGQPLVLPISGRHRLSDGLRGCREAPFYSHAHWQ